MKNKKTIITRRDFLKGTALVGLSAVAGMPIDFQPKQSPKTKVVLIRDKAVFDSESGINVNVVQSMLDKAMMALFEENDVAFAWRKIINSNDLVGIKTNVWRYLPTPAALEQAITKRIVEAGVPEKNISLDDRGVRHNPVFQKATVLINVRPLRTHYWSGIGGCIKNCIMFVPRPSD